MQDQALASQPTVSKMVFHCFSLDVKLVAVKHVEKFHPMLGTPPGAPRLIGSVLTHEVCHMWPQGQELL